jgi:hypothetical protein
MISGRTASDTHFSRPKPARATRRPNQSLPLGRDVEDLAPPPPYHYTHTSSDEYTSDSGNSSHHKSSDDKVTALVLHESPLGAVQPRFRLYHEPLTENP